MIRCVIVDDEIGAIDILREYIDRTAGLTCVTAFRDPVEALNYCMENPVDCLFLDIDMPNLSGLQLSKLLKNRGIQIVFCTAYSEFAVESYEHEALDYLLKPIPYDRFLKAAGKLRKSQTSRGDRGGKEMKTIFIKSGSKLHQVALDSVLYLKKEGHYMVFHTVQGRIMTRMTMDELLSVLPASRFTRVHKSYVIALDRINMIEKHELFINGFEIPIGDHYRKDFFSRIQSSGS